MYKFLILLIVFNSYAIDKLTNPHAYIPAQCYTKTIDNNGNIHNPCYSCHRQNQPPNYIEDDDLQLSYDFPTIALQNPWTNLFKDRSQAIAEIPDQVILDYIRQDNYKDNQGNIILVNILPDNWQGYLPDLYYNLDEQGFDHDLQGEYTLWRAFAYTPFLGTFWPTNGSTDDVFIRLPHVFAEDDNGNFNIEIYIINLAIVEAMIKRQNITISAIEEKLYNIDLNKNNKLDIAREIVYDWKPLQKRYMSYIGKAQGLKIAAGLFPQGTEFIHTVRYLDIQNEKIALSARIKELRYAKKLFWYNYSQLKQEALDEVKDQDDYPERLREIPGDEETGVFNGQGWVYQGFIEDQQGNLRPQTYEEQVFCIGCHSGLSATTDGIFSFPRLYAWHHWSQQDLTGVKEPKDRNGNYDYSFYLQNNGAGDEFRENNEIMEKFFIGKKLKPEMLEILHQDISALLYPTQERALELNKAYKIIVEEQSFIQGRDVVIKPVENVYQAVEAGQETGIIIPIP